MGRDVLCLPKFVVSVEVSQQVRLNQIMRPRKCFSDFDVHGVTGIL